jgi:alanine dehydrogenase
MQEKRVTLVPDGVGLLVANGYSVLVETGAGAAAKFSDADYSEAGAQIVYSTEELFKNSNILLKINPPTRAEIQMMSNRTTLISALQMSQLGPELIQDLNNKQITGVAWEMLEDEVGNLPIVRSLSEIAGSTVMLIAADYLNSNNDGRGVILGGITGVPPTKVVILGAGTVAQYAARTAYGLGAEVKIFDNHLYKLRRVRQELGAQIYTSIIDNVNLLDALKRADLVIGALRPEEGRNMYMVSEEMVAAMKPNSVIVDVSIDSGGCFETSMVTTHDKPYFKRYDVIHYCVPNIASRVAHTASQAISNLLSPMLAHIDEIGGVEEMIFSKDWFMRGVYCYKGSLTNRHLARRLNMKHRDLNLFRLSRL